MKANTSRRYGNRRDNFSFSSLFGPKTTYKVGASKRAYDAAYKAGRESGDTGEFEIWWDKYRGKEGVNKKKAKEFYEKGVEGEPSPKEEAEEAREDVRELKKKVVGIRGKYRGCNIYFDPETKEYFSSCDRDSKFESYAAAKKHVDYAKDQLRQNPYMGFEQLVKSGMSPSLAAWIGRRKYGKKTFQRAATEGRKLGRRKRGNPAAVEVEQISEGFHGRPVREVVEDITEEEYETEFAGLGLLCELEIECRDDEDKVIPITFNYKNASQAIILACDREGNIEFIGGDQKLDLEGSKDAFELGDKEIEKEWVKLGYVKTISYYADKHHLEGPKSQARGTEYIHTFGEEGGELPCLMYNTRNECMELVGGDYTISDEGIRN